MAVTDKAKFKEYLQNEAANVGGAFDTVGALYYKRVE